MNKLVVSGYKFLITKENFPFQLGFIKRVAVIELPIFITNSIIQHVSFVGHTIFVFNVIVRIVFHILILFVHPQF